MLFKKPYHPHTKTLAINLSDGELAAAAGPSGSTHTKKLKGYMARYAELVSGCKQGLYSCPAQ